MISRVKEVCPSSKEPQNKIPTIKDKTAPEVSEQSAALFKSLVIKKMKEDKNK